MFTNRRTTLCDNKIVTNDLVQIDGNRFKVLGRLDDVIISAGYKLHPAQIEQKMEGLLTTPFFLGTGKDEVAGQSAVLVVEGEMPLKETYQLWQHLEAKLAAFEMPRSIYFLPRFEYLESGKINKRKTLEKVISF